MYLDQHGIYETNRKKTFLNFVKNGTFTKDALSLLPIDWIYILIFGPSFHGKYTTEHWKTLKAYFISKMFF